MHPHTCSPPSGRLLWSVQLAARSTHHRPRPPHSPALLRVATCCSSPSFAPLSGREPGLYHVRVGSRHVLTGLRSAQHLNGAAVAVGGTRRRDGRWQVSRLPWAFVAPPRSPARSSSSTLHAPFPQTRLLLLTFDLVLPLFVCTRLFGERQARVPRLRRDKVKQA